MLQLVHQGFVDVQTAGGIQKDDVIAVIFGVFYRFLSNTDRIILPHFKNRDIDLLAYDLKLIDRRRTVYITGSQQRPAALPAHPSG